MGREKGLERNRREGNETEQKKDEMRNRKRTERDNRWKDRKGRGRNVGWGKGFRCRGQSIQEEK